MDIDDEKDKGLLENTRSYFGGAASKFLTKMSGKEVDLNKPKVEFIGFNAKETRFIESLYQCVDETFGIYELDVMHLDTSIIRGIAVEFDKPFIEGGKDSLTAA